MTKHTWPRRPFSPATAGELSTPSGSTFARSSSGRVIRSSRFSMRRDRTSSSTARRSRSGASPLQRLTDDCRRCAASTASPISTGEFRPTRLSTCDAQSVYPSEGRGMDRGELGTFLFTAERFDRDHAALAVLLGLNGLRVSEACGTNIEDLGFDRGHRTLRIIGKGNKPAVIPLVPRAARTIDLAVGERSEGPILRRRDGERLDRRTAHRWVRSIGKRAGLRAVHPHMLRAGFIMAALDAGVPLRDVQIAARHADPRTTTVYDRRRENFSRRQPTSSSSIQVRLNSPVLPKLLRTNR